MHRQLRAEVLLVENVRSLLNARGIDSQALAQWCGHKPAWISKILSGERGVQTADIGKIADFFGLTVSQLFQQGISPLTERRKAARRTGGDRRVADRRQSEPMHGRLHPDTGATFPAPTYRKSANGNRDDDDIERTG